MLGIERKLMVRKIRSKNGGGKGESEWNWENRLKNEMRGDGSEEENRVERLKVELRWLRGKISNCANNKRKSTMLVSNAAEQ